MIRTSLAVSLFTPSQRRHSFIRRIALAAIAAGAILIAAPAWADVIYGTSGSNIVAYNTQTHATTTTPGANLYFQSYGIAYGPDGNLYIVDRIPNQNLEKIEIYSTGGADLGTFANNLPYGSLGNDVVFDHAGNLYLTTTSSGNGEVEKFPVGGGAPILLGGGSIPYQLAVDNLNNIYVTDFNNSIYEFHNGSGPPVILAFQNAGGVAADNSGFIYATMNSNSQTIQYPAAGGAPTANPFSNQGGYGIVFDPGTNSLFTVSPPGLYQIDLANGNPSTNSAHVSSVFNGTEFLTVQVVPEPTSLTLLSLGAGLLIWRTRRARKFPG
jgi:hypothetical protein